MKIKTRDGRFIELNDLSRDEMLQLKNQTEIDMAELDSQLLAAKQKVVTGDGYSDPDWYRRATLARKLKGKAVQEMQRLLGKSKKTRTTSFEREFVNIAQRLLDGETFAMIAQEARDTVDAAG